MRTLYAIEPITADNRRPGIPAGHAWLVRYDRTERFGWLCCHTCGTKEEAQAFANRLQSDAPRETFAEYLHLLAKDCYESGNTAHADDHEAAAQAIERLTAALILLALAAKERVTPNTEEGTNTLEAIRGAARATASVEGVSNAYVAAGIDG